MILETVVERLNHASGHVVNSSVTVLWSDTDLIDAVTQARVYQEVDSRYDRSQYITLCKELARC